MKKVLSAVYLLGCFALSFGVESTPFYENSIFFTAFSRSHPEGMPFVHNQNIWDFGCDPAGPLTVVIHGWQEKLNERDWIRETIRNFLNLRGNCVFYMDYSNFSTGGYYDLTPHHDGISAVLTKKIISFENNDNILLYGFSFGARLAIDAGIESGLKGYEIDKIYACEPAGPGFFWYAKNSQKAAKYVECIHTSTDKGTAVYNCHRNWRMGNCGTHQLSAADPPLGSHGLCPYMFNSAFHNDFRQQNLYGCWSWRPAPDLPEDLIMGPRESRTSYIGDVFAPTARWYPWAVINNVTANDHPGYVKKFKNPSEDKLSSIEYQPIITENQSRSTKNQPVSIQNKSYATWNQNQK